MFYSCGLFCSHRWDVAAPHENPDLRPLHNLLGQKKSVGEHHQLPTGARGVGLHGLGRKMGNMQGATSAHSGGFRQMHPPPQVLLLHLGENNLGKRITISLRLQAWQNFANLVKCFLVYKSFGPTSFHVEFGEGQGVSEESVWPESVSVPTWGGWSCPWVVQ